jgi:hypothetical protein
LTVFLGTKPDDTFQVKGQESTEHVDVQSDAHVADSEEIEFGHFKPVFDGLGFDKSFAGMDLSTVLVFGEFGGGVESISGYFFPLGDFLFELFGLFVAGFGEGDFLDVSDEEDAGGKASGSYNVGDDSVFPDSVRHELEDDDTHS